MSLTINAEFRELNASLSANLTESNHTLTAEMSDAIFMGDKHFVFHQATASNTWSITHNLGKYPSVTVVDSGQNTVIGDVEYLTLNTLVVTFSAAFSGYAYLN